MAGIDWTFLADKSGEGIESLIATLLRQKNPTARQTNPSQGDGGIDVLMETDDGLVVWQVKKFTSPLSAGQWAQVKKSWKRFNREHGSNGDKVAKYYLVTPWTPTDERLADFRELTDEADFPTQWDGEAFITGLADQFPGTIERFLYGPAALERFIMAKSVLASSPVERSDDITMLEATESRYSSLDELRATMSDNYRIERGQVTMANEYDSPLPSPGSSAVFHRMTYLGDGRWTTEAVVPKTADALNVEPITLEVTYLDPEGTPEYQAVRDWFEWGTPFKDVRARTIQRGGPLGDEESEEATLSFSAVSSKTYPGLLVRVTKPDESVRMVQPLRTVEVTHGVSTGWIRLLAETPNKVLSFDFRLKLDEAPKVDVTLGNVEGLDPANVKRELDNFLAIEETDTFVIELDTGVPMLRGTGMRLPTGMSGAFRPVAAGLMTLQANTSQQLTMPNVWEIETGQFENFLAYVSIYEGKPKQWEWSERRLHAPDNPDEIEQFKSQLRKVSAGDVKPVLIQRPTIWLASSAYLIEHATATTPYSIAPIPASDIEKIQPGDVVLLKPGTDRRITTAAVDGWPEEDVSFLPVAPAAE